MVASALEQAHGWDPGSVDIMAVKTSGDRIQDRPLAEVGGKALWTKELDLALLAGETDCSVHSMKDVESERPGYAAHCSNVAAGGCARPAGWRRIHRRTASRSAGGNQFAAPCGPAEAASPRPGAVPIRGNVDTRLAKLKAGEVGATLLAAAGLDRLGQPEVGKQSISPKCYRPRRKARSGSNAASTIRDGGPAGQIDHFETHQAVLAERAFCRALGGTCHSPVAALARIEGEEVALSCEILSEDGREHVARRRKFSIGDLEQPASLAREMLEVAPLAIRRLFEPNG